MRKEKFSREEEKYRKEKINRKENERREKE